jgi:hypothetical protein
MIEIAGAAVGRRDVHERPWEGRGAGAEPGELVIAGGRILAPDGLLRGHLVA